MIHNLETPTFLLNLGGVFLDGKPEHERLRKKREICFYLAAAN